MNGCRNNSSASARSSCFTHRQRSRKSLNSGDKEFFFLTSGFPFWAIKYIAWNNGKRQKRETNSSYSTTRTEITSPPWNLIQNHYLQTSTSTKSRWIEICIFKGCLHMHMWTYYMLLKYTRINKHYNISV